MACAPVMVILAGDMVTGARCTSVCDVRCRVATKTIDDGHGVQESHREHHHQRPSRSPWTSSRCMIIIDLTVAAFSAVTSNPIKHQQHPAVTEPFWSRKKLKPSISAPGTGSQIVSWFIAYLRCAWWHVHPMPHFVLPNLTRLNASLTTTSACSTRKSFGFGTQQSRQVC